MHCPEVWPRAVFAVYIRCMEGALQQLRLAASLLGSPAAVGVLDLVIQC
jgi:hypothetical protein